MRHIKAIESPDLLPAAKGDNNNPGGSGLPLQSSVSKVPVDSEGLLSPVVVNNRVMARPLSMGASPSDAQDTGEIICFTTGTLIRTPSGERRIETLKPGDEVITLDRGPQVLRWIGRDTVRATGALAPVLFSKGSVGNYYDLRVSPWHRMLYRGNEAHRLFGKHEVLATARALVDDCRITVEYGGMVTYVHMLFDRHEIVIANGAPSESFHPGQNRLATLPGRSRDDLFSVMPHLRSDPGAYGPATRPCVDGIALATA